MPWSGLTALQALLHSVETTRVQNIQQQQHNRLFITKRLSKQQASRLSCLHCTNATRHRPERASPTTTHPQFLPSSHTLHSFRSSPSHLQLSHLTTLTMLSSSFLLVAPLFCSLSAVLARPVETSGLDSSAVPVFGDSDQPDTSDTTGSLSRGSCPPGTTYTTFQEDFTSLNTDAWEIQTGQSGVSYESDGVTLTLDPSMVRSLLSHPCVIVR